MRRTILASVFLVVALAGAADGKPTCVVIHANGHNMLVRKIADALRARLVRSTAFVIGDGQRERSLHMTLRYGAVRLPDGVPPPARDHSNINVSLEYRTPPPRSLGFEGSETIEMYCDDRTTSRCVEQILKMAYMIRHINHTVFETGSPLPACMHELDPHCTSSEH